MKKTLLLLLLTISAHNLLAQEFVSLNKYEIEIKDLSKYKVAYYGKWVKDELDEQHMLIYDTLFHVFAENYTFYTVDRKIRGSIRIEYDLAGDTTRFFSRDYIKSNLRNGYYEHGKRIAEFNYENRVLVLGWELNEKGEKISVKRDRFLPVQKILSKEYTKLLQRKLRYPRSCIKEKISGTVRLALYVDAEGYLKSVEVMNPEAVDVRLQEEAIRVVSSFNQRFFPAEDRLGNPTEGCLKQVIHFNSTIPDKPSTSNYF